MDYRKWISGNGDFDSSTRLEEVVADALGLPRGHQPTHPKTVGEAQWVLVRLLLASHHHPNGLGKLLNFLTNTIYKITKTSTPTLILPGLVYANAAVLLVAIVDATTPLEQPLILVEDDVEEAVVAVGGGAALKAHPLSRLIAACPESLGAVLAVLVSKIQRSDQHFALKALPFLLYLTTPWGHWEPVMDSIGGEVFDALVDLQLHACNLSNLQELQYQSIYATMLACFVKRQLAAKAPTIEAFCQLQRILNRMIHQPGLHIIDDLLYGLLDACCSFWAAGFPVAGIIDNLVRLSSASASAPSSSVAFFHFAIACMTVGDPGRAVPLSQVLGSTFITHCLGVRWRAAWAKLAIAQQSSIGIDAKLQATLKSALTEENNDVSDDASNIGFDFESANLRSWLAYHRAIINRTEGADDGLVFDGDCPPILFPAHLLHLTSKLPSPHHHHHHHHPSVNPIRELVNLAQTDPSYHEIVLYTLLFALQSLSLSASSSTIRWSDILSALVAISCLPDGTASAPVLAVLSHMLRTGSGYRKHLIPLIAQHILRGNRRAALFSLLQSHLPVLPMEAGGGGLVAFAQSLYYLAQVVEKQSYLQYALSMCTQFMKRPPPSRHSHEEIIARGLIVDTLALLSQALVIDPVAVWDGLGFGKDYAAADDDDSGSSCSVLLLERILCFARTLFSQSVKTADGTSEPPPPPPQTTIDAIGFVHRTLISNTDGVIVDAAAGALAAVPVAVLQATVPIEVDRLLAKVVGGSRPDDGITSLLAHLINAEVEGMSRSVFIGSSAEKTFGSSGLSSSFSSSVSVSEKVLSRVRALLASPKALQNPAYFVPRLLLLHQPSDRSTITIPGDIPSLLQLHWYHRLVLIDGLVGYFEGQEGSGGGGPFEIIESSTMVNPTAIASALLVNAARLIVRDRQTGSAIDLDGYLRRIGWTLAEQVLSKDGPSEASLLLLNPSLPNLLNEEIMTALVLALAALLGAEGVESDSLFGKMLQERVIDRLVGMALGREAMPTGMPVWPCMAACLLMGKFYAESVSLETVPAGRAKLAAAMVIRAKGEGDILSGWALGEIERLAQAKAPRIVGNDAYMVQALLLLLHSTESKVLPETNITTKKLYSCVCMSEPAEFRNLSAILNSAINGGADALAEGLATIRSPAGPASIKLDWIIGICACSYFIKGKPSSCLVAAAGGIGDFILGVEEAGPLTPWLLHAWLSGGTNKESRRLSEQTATTTTTTESYANIDAQRFGASSPLIAILGLLEREDDGVMAMRVLSRVKVLPRIDWRARGIPVDRPEALAQSLEFILAHLNTRPPSTSVHYTSPSLSAILKDLLLKGAAWQRKLTAEIIHKQDPTRMANLLCSVYTPIDLGAIMAGGVLGAEGVGDLAAFARLLDHIAPEQLIMIEESQKKAILDTVFKDREDSDWIWSKDWISYHNHFASILQKDQTFDRLFGGQRVFLDLIGAAESPKEGRLGQILGALRKHRDKTFHPNIPRYLAEQLFLPTTATRPTTALIKLLDLAIMHAELVPTVMVTFTWLLIRSSTRSWPWIRRVYKREEEEGIGSYEMVSEAWRSFLQDNEGDVDYPGKVCKRLLRIIECYEGPITDQQYSRLCDMFLVLFSTR